MSEVYVCNKCHSRDVQHAHWVKLNNDEVVDLFGTWCNGDNSWCPQCEEHTHIDTWHVFEDLNDHCQKAIVAFQMKTGDNTDPELWLWEVTITGKGPEAVSYVVRGPAAQASDSP